MSSPQPRATAPTSSPLSTKSEVSNAGGVSAALLVVLALLSALAPFAIDMYLPAFPTMTADLNTSATSIQLTLTAFFIGIAAGQLVFGPLSDRFGRVRPLVIGSILLILASAAAALAPTVGILIVARFVQGLTGAAGMVVGRAIVSDLAVGKPAARAFSLMMVVSGVAPVLAPFVGSLLVGPVGWRGVLWVVTALSVLMLAAVLLVVRESHPAERRAHARIRVPGEASPMRALWSRVFIANTVTFIFAFAVMMAYISASPFVYQVMIGMGPVTYGITFGVNALGLVGASAFSARLAHAVGPARVLQIGIAVMLVSTAALFVLVVTGAPAATFIVPIFIAVASVGLVLGNATALALGAVPKAAGTASAVLGAAQFALAALVSPMVTIAGEDTALPLAITMLAAAVIALIGIITARNSTREAIRR
ncbi:multidrug effflux MFS transporter [Cryobacterium arcticum]|uniref:MFS transporter n=1 Tax=Cryobacterium arcticum TaxID=670052 RepID=A0A1B1BPY6_9MICO|nr:multidrug effflux MFS transporter [Cryobacterium arcticum]ANP74443.1 MFS transporter [Cryobacterium arcticum]